jgi:peptidyl-dipeptidase Dcp
LVVDDPADLDGLSESDRAAAAEAAAERGLVGKWLLRLHNTTQQPYLESLKDRAVRRRLFEASLHRADSGGETDTRAIVQRLSELRAERAALLGYSTVAAYALDDQMAKTPETAIKLLTDIARVAAAKARGEAAKIQALIDREAGGVPLEPWDWQYYAAKVRTAEYDIDEAQIKPYLELNRVLRDGVFYAARQLYGLTFDERRDLPTYHPDVRVFEVHDEDGSSMGLFYADYFKRDNKSGGAWMDSFVDQSELFGTRPVIINAANFTKPAAGQPALLSFDDVTTLFHEFGHGLHGLLSRVKYPMLSGTNVPRDFVEFPSQFNEHCALDPTVLRCYARHHQTGAPMPQELVDKIKKSRNVQSGFRPHGVSGGVFARHGVAHASDRRAPASVDEFEVETLQRYQVEVHEVPPRYRTTYFATSGTVAIKASYYAYLWAEVLDHDTFAWFTERGGLTRENGRLFREMILSRGGTRDADALYREFRGRVPSIEPLLFHRGLRSEEGADIMSIVE